MLKSIAIKECTHKLLKEEMRKRGLKINQWVDMVVGRELLKMIKK